MFQTGSPRSIWNIANTRLTALFRSSTLSWINTSYEPNEMLYLYHNHRKQMYIPMYKVEWVLSKLSYIRFGKCRHYSDTVEIDQTFTFTSWCANHWGPVMLSKLSSLCTECRSIQDLLNVSLNTLRSIVCAGILRGKLYVDLCLALPAGNTSVIIRFKITTIRLDLNDTVRNCHVTLKSSVLFIIFKVFCTNRATLIMSWP